MELMRQKMAAVLAAEGKDVTVGGPGRETQLRKRVGTREGDEVGLMMVIERTTNPEDGALGETVEIEPAVRRALNDMEKREMTLWMISAIAQGGTRE